MVSTPDLPPISRFFLGEIDSILAMFGVVKAFQRYLPEFVADRFLLLLNKFLKYFPYVDTVSK